MNRKTTIVPLLCFFFLIVPELVLSRPGLESYPREQVHLYMLAGQSNMAGRGEIGEESNMAHPRVFALSKEGKWVPAVHPIHWDKKSAGVGLGKSFAVALAQEDEDIIIGLIPTACGGSSISTWVPGGFHDQTKSHPYDDAISRTRRAMEDGELKAILWHQGESDSNPKQASSYEENLKDLVERFRTDLGDDELPFIIGQLGRFPAKPWNEHREMIDQAHHSVATQMHQMGFVSSDGLTSLSDNIHFDSSSLREFGNRYARVYLDLRKSGNISTVEIIGIIFVGLLVVYACLWQLWKTKSTNGS